MKIWNMTGLGFLRFNKTQEKIIKECKVANIEEYRQWFLNNVVWPTVIILLPVVMYYVIPNNVESVRVLLFNGSFALLGVNILFGMSSYLIKIDRLKINDNEEDSGGDKLNQDVLNLRERLNSYKNILLLLGGVFYFIQTISSYKSDYAFYGFVALTVIVLIASIRVGRYMFIIKDDFFEKTFFGQINTEVQDTTKRWGEKYN